MGLFSFYQKRKTSKNLLIRIGGLGDVIMTLGLIQTVSQKKDQRLVVLTHRKYQELFDLVILTGVEVWYSDYDFNQKTTFLERVLGTGSILKKLMGLQFDRVYLCYQDKRYRWLLWSCRYKEILDLNGVKALSNEYFGKILLRFEAHSSFSFPKTRFDSIEKINNQIMLFPGGNGKIEEGKSLRQWPVESFVRLATLLIEKGYRVYIAGSLADAIYRPFFSSLPVQFSFTDSIQETFVLLKSAFCVVAFDSGPLHLSILANTRLVALFGPTEANSRVPLEMKLNNQIKVITAGKNKVACAPCYDGKKYAACLNPICMKEINPETVFKGIVHFEDRFSS